MPAKKPPKKIRDTSPKVRYTLRRSGGFAIEVAGPAHCSVLKQGLVALRYTLIIQCTQLDADHFVHSQEELSEFFDDLGATTLSCEMLAMHCAGTLWSRISKNIGSSNLRVEVEISPPPYVGSASASIGEVK